jgi:hypothetical protein
MSACAADIAPPSPITAVLWRVIFIGECCPRRGVQQDPHTFQLPIKTRLRVRRSVCPAIKACRTQAWWNGRVSETLSCLDCHEGQFPWLRACHAQARVKFFVCPKWLAVRLYAGMPQQVSRKGGRFYGEFQGPRLAAKSIKIARIVHSATC